MPTGDQSRYLQRGCTRSSELRVVLSAGRARLSGRDVVGGSGPYSAAEFSHPGILGKPFVLGVADRTEDAAEKYRNRLEVRALCLHPCRNCAARSRALHHDDTHRTTLHSPTRRGARAIALICVYARMRDLTLPSRGCDHPSRDRASLNDSSREPMEQRCTRSTPNARRCVTNT
jgi:hypothetical protein